jgi:cell division protein FtsZ
MGDDLRVTVVATGLGRAASKKTPFTVIKTGTDNAPVGIAPVAQAAADYGHLEVPAVWRTGRESAAARVAAMEDSGTDRYDIPAFLRKQAD